MSLIMLICANCNDLSRGHLQKSGLAMQQGISFRQKDLALGSNYTPID